MYVFPNIYVTPLIIPKQQFIDRYGNTNEYVSMNPSMFIKSSGHITILVRCVNYKKYRGGAFIVYDPVRSMSIYSILRGNLKINEHIILDDFLLDNITVDYNHRIYDSYWKGLEDIRFINEDQILATIPELNKQGQASIFLANLYDTTISCCIPCEPSILEKNWMPYVDHNGEDMVIYSVEPFQIKSIFDADLELIETPGLPSLAGYHGSTNGIKYKDGYSLFLIHKFKDVTHNRWICYNPSTKSVKVSSEFVFFKHSYIEFPCSLCEWQGRYFVSMGVNDDTAYIVEIESSKIDELFE